MVELFACLPQYAASIYDDLQWLDIAEVSVNERTNASR
jgi:hypothetical protein